MRASIRVTIFGALATGLSSLAFIPLAEPRGWVWQALTAVVLVAVTGVAGRLTIRLPAVILVAQLVVLTVWLTLLFARDQALFGILPGPDALSALDDLLAAGLADIGRYPTPIPAESPSAALIVAGVAMVAVAVDLLAAGLRIAPWAGLPLFLLYTVPATSPDGINPLLFVLAGGGYVALLLAEGHDRAVISGRQLPTIPRFDPLSDPGRQPESKKNLPARVGSTIGVTVLAVAVAVPALLPGVLSDGLFSDLGNNDSTPWSGSPPSAAPNTSIDFNPMVSIEQNLNLGVNLPAFSYRTTSNAPREQYFTLTTLDQFDGTRWWPSQPSTQEFSGPLPSPVGLSDGVRRQTISTSIALDQGFSWKYLLMPRPATEVQADGNWLADLAADAVVSNDGKNPAGLSYTIKSLEIAPTRSQLENAPQPPASIEERYTELSDDIPPIVAQLARDATRGARTDYAKALALQKWFTKTGGFKYDLEAKSGGGSSAFVTFLTSRRGYCQQYAGTFAVMARQFGIPARVAIGYTPGVKQPDGSYRVGTHDAHAWPELYFEGVGWVRFEPTPSIAGARGNSPDWALSDGPPIPQPTTSTTTPSPAPATTEPVTTEPASAETASAAPGSPWLPATLVVGLIAVALAVLPMLARAVIRRRRRSVSPYQLADAAWAELQDSARDLGFTWAEGLTVRQLASELYSAIGSSPVAAPGPATGAALWRLTDATEQARFAPRPAPVGDLFDDVRLVRTLLASSRGRLARLRARVLPRSILTRRSAP